MSEQHWQIIAEQLRDATGSKLRLDTRCAVGGGSINSAWRVQTDRDLVFVKLNHAARAAMFEAEARGLQLLAEADALRVPTPHVWGSAGEHAFLVLEWIELRPGGAGCAAQLGRRLAGQHRLSTRRRYGLDHDNTIGSTPQPNGEMDDWTGFLRERRLGYQLELAARHGLGRRLVERGERLLELLPAFFGDYRPVSSLLHGDLWGGNWSADENGAPVVYDPAVYYGDRESDLAMTELFGGFPAAFYNAYDEAWQRAPGYARRRELYQLYHVLNHANLFGGYYAGQAERIIERLIASAGG